MHRRWVATATIAASALLARPASARSVQEERYGAEVAWNAAVRLLRVDLGFAITERDHDAGFILFTYRDTGRPSQGSVEIVPAQVEGVAGCRVVVQLAEQPSYVERLILSRLQHKLRDEYGEPPPPARPGAGGGSAGSGDRPPSEHAPAGDDRAPSGSERAPSDDRPARAGQ